MSFSEYGGWSWRLEKTGWEKILRSEEDQHFQSIGEKDFFVVIGNPEQIAIGAWKYSARVYQNGIEVSGLEIFPPCAPIRGSIDGWEYAATITKYPAGDPRKAQGTMFWLRSPEGIEEAGICGSCLGDFQDWRKWIVGALKPAISHRRALLKVTSWLGGVR